MWSKHDASTLQDHCNAVFSTALGHLEDLLVHTLCLFSINHIHSTQNWDQLTFHTIETGPVYLYASSLRKMKLL